MIKDFTRTNLIRNASFESGDLRHWTTNDPNNILVTNTLAHSGQYSCIFEETTVQGGYVRQGYFKCAEAYTVLISAFIYREHRERYIYCFIRFYTIDKRPVAQHGAFAGGGVGFWQAMQGVAIAPPRSALFEVRFAYYGSGFYKCYVDDVYIPVMTHARIASDNVLLVKRT